MLETQITDCPAAAAAACTVGSVTPPTLHLPASGAGSFELRYVPGSVAGRAEPDRCSITLDSPDIGCHRYVVEGEQGVCVCVCVLQDAPFRLRAVAVQERHCSI